jgi:hypothetical protein
MKPILFIFFPAILLIVSCSDYSLQDKDPAAFIIPSYKAKEDFGLFREILEKAHPSLYSYQSRKKSDNIFDSIAGTITKGITYRDFYNKLFFVTNETGCSHSVVTLPQHVSDSLFSRNLFFPVPVLWVEGKLLINYSGIDLPVGTEIVKINGLAASAVLDSLLLYNPVEGFHRESQKYMASAAFGFEYFMKFGGCTNFNIVIKDTTGNIKTVFLRGINYENLSYRQENRYYTDPTDVKYSLLIDDSLKKATLRLTTFEFEPPNQQIAFEAFLKNSFELLSKKADIKTLVIDLRENGGGFLRYCFLLNSYLSAVPFAEYSEVFSRVKSVPYTKYLSDQFTAGDLEFVNAKLDEEFEKTRYPVQQLKDTAVKVWIPDQFRFKGMVYIITNWHVNSAASYFAHLARKTANAKVVGMETAGGTHSGNGFKTIRYRLPATGLEFEFPFAKMIYTSGDKKTGRGMIPDYIVPDSYGSFNNNEDRQQLFINDSLLKKNRR